MRIMKITVALAAAAVFVVASSICALAQEKKVDERPPIAAKDVKPYVDGIIKAYGGKAGIEGVKNVYVKADITADRSGENGTNTYYLERPGKLRVEIKYTRSAELRILDGKDGWRGENKADLKKVTDFQYSSMLYQYQQLEIPYGVLTNQYKVTWTGEAIVGGRHADVLAFDRKDGVAMDVYVDSKNFMILKTVGYITMNGRPVDLTAEFSDFRKVGGTMLPFVINNYSQDTLLGKSTVVECKVNTPMKASLFRP